MPVAQPDHLHINTQPAGPWSPQTHFQVKICSVQHPSDGPSPGPVPPIPRPQRPSARRRGSWAPSQIALWVGLLADTLVHVVRAQYLVRAQSQLPRKESGSLT